ncbi:MAG TPA: APC family permease [Candidatus Saccharimonadales bacterium]|jgi:amino acid transporter|nr:APC family permease [Candidatus Saccharimonadales bacterium]
MKTANEISAAQDKNGGGLKDAAKISVVPMIAATYFMVAGGPYGLEDIVQKTGYAATLLILVVTPLLWSLPTAMMVSELATAIPEEGGFYIWVRRGMGRFWGFQETWLTLAGSVFEMALYPNLCISYIGQFAPGVVAGHRGMILGFAMIAICTAWNILGVRSVGEGSVWMNVALLVPFIALTIFALGSGRFGGVASASAVPLRHADLLGGVLIAMWNYMGWDNLSTIAGEVEAPKRTYSRAMLGAVLLVIASYLIPVAAVAHMGIDPNRWTTGGWADIGRIVGGETLAVAIALAGVIGAIGSFGALMLSFTRLPMVMAEDGYLPQIFTRRSGRTGAPWVAILACAILWAACFPLGFEKSLLLDVLLTGLSILLEFWALVALRVREPELSRPFRVPGGLAGAVAIGVPPLALMVAAFARNRAEIVGSTNEMVIGFGVIAAGVVLYFLSRAISGKKIKS